MNIAQSIKSYYEHEDFIDNYAMYLLEDTHAVEQRLKDIFKSYDFERLYGDTLELTDDEVEILLDYIRYNAEDFTSTYNGYWVGGLSLDSVGFGEQEEEIYSLINHRTGKPYTRAYIKSIFEREDFYVSDSGYAYYDMSSEGVQINVKGFESLEQIKNILRDEQ